jgi:ATP-binding cassette, subfamily B, heavy metal transporter
MRRNFLAPGEKITNFSTWQLIKDYAILVSPYKGRFIGGSILRLFSDVSNLYSTYALAAIITILGQGNISNNSYKIWTILFTWSAITIFRTFSMYFGKRLLYSIGTRVYLDVEKKALHHLFQLDIAWHEKENTGNKLKRINNAGDGYARLTNIWANNFIEIFVNFIGTIIILSQFNRTVSLITFIFLITYLIFAKLLRNRVALAVHEVNVKGEEVNGLEYEAMSNIRTAKIMSMVPGVMNTLKVKMDQLYYKIQQRIFWMQTSLSGETFLAQIFKIGTLIFIISSILKGHAEVGLLILFNNYFNNVWQSVDELSNVSQDVLVARYSISRLKEVMNEPVQIDDETDKKHFPAKWQTIELKNVSFAYGDNQVLKDISFTIHRGEKIGVIGLSGAGKSTLFKLLLKEYESFEGEILIDGVRIQEISKHDYFKHVAVVLQETEVFNFSLRENIYLAGPGTSNKEVELQKALSVAHVTDFLPKLPDGVDTAIGEKGVRLSGGEKQRLGIARAVFKQPQLLLLDEATSHLDLESEEKIQDSLHQFFHSVTAIVIAHRLTTIKEMDKIIVIEDGEILESGNFAELTAKRGRFYELWEKQRL